MRGRFDLVAIGGGTAGLVASLGGLASEAGPALIEADRLGGDRLWTGCVPSKALLAAAVPAQAMRAADRQGLDPVEPVVDLARVMATVRRAQAVIEPAFLILGVLAVGGLIGVVRTSLQAGFTAHCDAGSPLIDALRG